MRSPDFIIKIAADSVQRLRDCDVGRVLENCSDAELEKTAGYIIESRRDLEEKVIQELDYQLEERRGV